MFRNVPVFQLLRAIKLSGPSNDVRLLEVSELTGPPEDSPLRNNSDGECVHTSVLGPVLPGQGRDRHCRHLRPSNPERIVSSDFIC